ncbi:T9SS C-terminal target domain-containing protein [Fibrobacter sp.]|uniref:T9SS C-terminal target domain-containing protein n=1 Tax=Fibrobacter sp. TaxID=35828 RepID=UPI0038900ADF
MNKKILTASAFLAAASMSFGFETWQGDGMIYQINTELDAGGEKSGYWFNYGDDADGGASTVTWPVDKGTEWSPDALDPIIDYCNGVCGTFKLSKGTLTYDPFVGIGFNVAGSTDADSDVMVAADATAMGGVCIAYSVDVGASLEMGLGDAEDKVLGYDNPFVTLAKSTTGTVKEFAWSGFKQAGWGDGKITGDEAAAKLVALKFKIQAKDGTSGEFNIMAIGANGGGCTLTAGKGGSAIGAKAIAGSLKAQLSGRTLSFGKSVAKAEIVNLQGQVVMAASSVKTMDLSKLQAGVYMVRAAGLSQQIMLK